MYEVGYNHFHKFLWEPGDLGGTWADTSGVYPQTRNRAILSLVQYQCLLISSSIAVGHRMSESSRATL